MCSFALVEATPPYQKQGYIMKKSVLVLAATVACVSTPALAQDASPFSGPYVGGVLGYDSVELKVDDVKGDDNSRRHFRNTA